MTGVVNIRIVVMWTLIACMRLSLPAGGMIHLAMRVMVVVRLLGVVRKMLRPSMRVVGIMRIFGWVFGMLQV